MEEWRVGWGEALSPVVNSASLGGLVTGLTRDQLRNIYDCTVDNWNQLFPAGGSRPIFVVARETTSPTYQTWLDLIGLPGAAGRTAEQNCLNLRSSQGLGARAVGNSGARDAVAANTNAVGYVGLGFLPFAGVTQTPVEGVLGTVATVQNGTYPLSRSLYLFTLKRGSTPAYPRPDTFGLAIQFVRLTVSAEGQAILAQEGYVPLPAPKSGPSSAVFPDCDVNVDFACNVLDITAVGGRFGQTTVKPKRNREDANNGTGVFPFFGGDGTVNILDVVAVGNGFGSTWTNW